MWTPVDLSLEPGSAGSLCQSPAGVWIALRLSPTNAKISVQLARVPGSPLISS